MNIQEIYSPPGSGKTYFLIPALMFYNAYQHKHKRRVKRFKIIGCDSSYQENYKSFCIKMLGTDFVTSYIPKIPIEIFVIDPRLNNPNEILINLEKFLADSDIQTHIILDELGILSRIKSDFFDNVKDNCKYDMLTVCGQSIEQRL